VAQTEALCRVRWYSLLLESLEFFAQTVLYAYSRDPHRPASRPEHFYETYCWRPEESSNI
jgi:hypothetical protein